MFLGIRFDDFLQEPKELDHVRKMFWNGNETKNTWKLKPLESLICCATTIKLRRKNSQCNEMANVPIIDPLSEFHSIVTECSPLAIKVSFLTGTYFKGIWLILLIEAGSISYSLL